MQEFISFRGNLSNPIFATEISWQQVPQLEMERREKPLFHQGLRNEQQLTKSSASLDWQEKQKPKAKQQTHKQQQPTRLLSDLSTDAQSHLEFEMQKCPCCKVAIQSTGPQFISFAVPELLDTNDVQKKLQFLASTHFYAAK